VRKKLLYLVSILVVIGFVIGQETGLISFDSFIESRKCLSKELALDEFIDGKLIEKFLNNQNHNFETIIVESPNSKKITSTILMGDISGLFSELKIGDTIKKEKGSLEFHVKSTDLEYVRTLEYGCGK